MKSAYLKINKGLSVSFTTPSKEPKINSIKINEINVEWICEQGTHRVKRLLYLHGGECVSIGLNSHENLAAGFRKPLSVLFFS